MLLMPLLAKSTVLFLFSRRTPNSYHFLKAYLLRNISQCSYRYVSYKSSFFSMVSVKIQVNKMEARRGPLSLTHDQVAELQETFNLFDLAGEGVIEMPRVKAFMLKLTPGLTKDLYARVISDAKLEGTDAINFAQFFLIVSTIGTVLPHSGKYNLDQLREVFEAFDPRHNGYIDLNHFMQIMLEEGEPLSQVEGKELILHLHRFGCLRKGEVNYRKFMSKVFSSDPAKVFSSSP